MRAVVGLGDGRVEVQDRPAPTPGGRELAIALASAGLNNADLLQARGNYPPPPGTPPDLLGLEVAGRVSAVGDLVTGWSVGQPALALVSGAAQAEVVVVDAELALLVPENLDLAEAGAVPEVFWTAADALFAQARLGVGDRLLVTGAAGGVGTAAIQLGRAAGATVVASTRHLHFGPDLVELGADRVVAPEDQASAGPFDVVLELVGAPSLVTVLPALSIGGRVVVIGTGAGSRAELDLRPLMRARGTISASTLRARPFADRVAVARLAERRVLPLLADGRIRPVVQARYPLSQAAEAYRRFAEGGKLGKIVLVAD
jgi:NADPH2:quinone reductase